MRRYWQPLRSRLKSVINCHCHPNFSEDLVAFRDGRAKPAHVSRCMHGVHPSCSVKSKPGPSLPYHGWMFDTQGHLLDTPCELDPTSTRLHNVLRQPWYRNREYGMAFAYMGRLTKSPAFPYSRCLMRLAMMNSSFRSAELNLPRRPFVAGRRADG